MRTFSKSLLMATAYMASLAGYVGTAHGHEVGDCVVAGSFSNCRLYLTSIAATDGFNYLSETTCPPCVQGDPQPIGIGGAVYYQQMCPKNKGWSDPKEANLDTANLHYDAASEDETGARVVDINDRLCWTGGECVEGECEAYLDYANGSLVLNFRCPRTGGRIWYKIKRLGNTCESMEEEYQY